MSKMDEAMFNGLWARAVDGNGDATDARWLAVEAARARSEEARFLKENAEKDARIAVLTTERDIARKTRDAKHEQLSEKDAQIKALADALEMVFRRGLASDVAYEAAVVALTRVGRKP